MAEALERIEFTGEVPGPGAEILVIDDNQAEVTDDTHVVTNVIARIAVLGYVTGERKEAGFTGLWTSQLEPGSPSVPIRLVGAKNSGRLQIEPAADTDPSAVHAGTSTGTRYYLKRSA